MLEKLRKFLNRSEFFKNVVTLISGTAIAQLFPILVSPILTRLYKPEDFGVLALFTSLTMIFGIVANGRYELAIVLPKKDDYAINIWALTVVIAGSISAILMISILLFHDFFVGLLKNNGISPWLYVLPFAVFFLATYNSLNYYFTRKKEFKTISAVKIVRQIFLSGFQMILYFLNNGVSALVGGFTIGQFSGSVGFGLKIFKDKKLLKKINKAKIIALAKRYKRFPQYTMLGSLFNRTATELPNVLISSFFNSATLGFYSLSYRMLSAPSSFIGMSIGQVYFKEAVDEVNRTGTAKSTFLKVSKRLIVISLPIFALLFLFAKPLFAFIFGKDWIIAGSYAQIITPLLFIRFIVSPLSVTLSVFEKQNISLLLQAGLLVFVIISFIFVLIFKLTFTNFLLIFVIIMFCYYSLFYFILFKIATSKKTI